VESLKVSGGLVRGYSRFVETIGGDWFDHDCRSMNAVDFTGASDLLRWHEYRVLVE
jgi:hypothetical protein